MGKASRDKGGRREREARDQLKANLPGFEVVKVPLSGAVATHPGDLTLTTPRGVELVVEVKARADGFRLDRKWLSGADILLKKADREDWLITMRLKDLPRLVGERGDDFNKI
ncbi:Archaeal Holliday junction resolvase [uncultured Mediterranean phage uvMED]|nr:Archaeal Holliday junction resolvase [uncultured Mediterranean phage uvMED]